MNGAHDPSQHANQFTAEFEENVAAIQASIDDMNCGEIGRDAEHVISELQRELNLRPFD